MKTYFTVGPSQIYPSVPKYLKEAVDTNILSLSHRGDVFKELFRDTINSLKELHSIPDDYYVFFLSSATECWERILENCVKETSFHVVSGAFSKKFYEAAEGFHKKVTLYEFDGTHWRLPKIAPDTELIAFTQNETSNGIMIPMEKIYEVKKAHPNSLIALDIVSSMPYVDIDYQYIDFTFFSVQKGMGLPAGLGVIVVSPQAMEKAMQVEKQIPMTTFRRFSQMKKYEDKNQTYETPNVLEIFLLNKVTKDLIKKGMMQIRKETDDKYEILRQFVKSSKRFSLSKLSEDFRSRTVMVLDVDGGSANVLKKLKEDGLVVGTGYEAMKDKQMRIANFPALSTKDMQNLVDHLQSFEV